MRGSARRLARSLIAIALVLAFAACASTPEGEDKNLEFSLADLYRSGGSLELAAMTGDYQWDTVYVFYGPSTGKVIDRTVGGSVVETGYQLQSGDTLLVFDYKAKPVRRAVVSQLFGATGMEKWNKKVRVYSTDCGLILGNPGGLGSRAC